MEAELFDFWKFLAGVGIFLFGMNQLEIALKEMAGKSFQVMLQKSTGTKLKGIFSGTLITAVLQSSSLVTLLVLAFLGAGLIGLKNAVGVVLGANLGTTFTAWIIASLGFKLSIASFAMPFLALGSIFFIFFNKKPYLKYLGLFAIGFGFIFLGLEFMKTAIEEVANQVDFQKFKYFGLWFFLLLGILITALIQSSSAMMVIILSAMSSGIISLTEGGVLIIGANIGTTITVSLGAFQGNADKKRLALAHFLFNFITAIVAFVFIEQLIAFTIHLFSIKDPLIELVLLNTIFNIMGILLFYPFINPLVNWLEKQFNHRQKNQYQLFIHEVSPTVPAAAIAALERDIRFTFFSAVNFISRLWQKSLLDTGQFALWKKIIHQPENLLDAYNQIKKYEDELTKYHVSIQENAKIDEEEAQKLTSLMISLRSIIYSVKDMKDILHNVKDLQDREDEKVYDFYLELKTYVFNFLNQTKKIEENYREKGQLFHLIQENKILYERLIADVYKIYLNQENQFSVSTMTNIIRQSVSSLDHLVQSLIHLNQNMHSIKVIDEFNGSIENEIFE
jgi:phosphate:Na+ symporter